MIQHDALPSDPDHEEIFEVPEELNLGVSAYIKIYQDNVHVGEATSLEKIQNVKHGWALSRVIFFSLVDFTKEVKVKTILLTAKTLCYINLVGWIIESFRDKPLQETWYKGFLSQTAILQETAMNNIQMYEHIAFNANTKGETL
jgi:hypothetical protein